MLSAFDVDLPPSSPSPTPSNTNMDCQCVHDAPLQSMLSVQADVEKTFEDLTFPSLFLFGDHNTRYAALERFGICADECDRTTERAFPTEIVVAPGDHHEFTVSIIPSDGRSIYDKTNLLAFRETFAGDVHCLGDLLQGAKEEIFAGSTDGSISDDVVRIDIRGPCQPYLRILDTPDIPWEDVVASDWSRRYLKDQRTFILAAVDMTSLAHGGYDEPLRAAREVDPTGERTLGIARLPFFSAQPTVTAVAEQTYPTLYARGFILPHGLHFLMRAAPEEMQFSEENEENEEMESLTCDCVHRFLAEAEGPPVGGAETYGNIKTVVPSAVGLKDRLASIFSDFAPRHLPGLVEEMRQRIIADVDAPPKIRIEMREISQQELKSAALQRNVDEVLQRTSRGPDPGSNYSTWATRDQRLIGHKNVITRVFRVFGCGMQYYLVKRFPWVDGEPRPSPAEHLAKINRLLEAQWGGDLSGAINAAAVSALLTRQYKRRAVFLAHYLTQYSLGDEHPDLWLMNGRLRSCAEEELFDTCWSLTEELQTAVEKSLPLDRTGRPPRSALGSSREVTKAVRKLLRDPMPSEFQERLALAELWTFTPSGISGADVRLFEAVGDLQRASGSTTESDELGLHENQVVIDYVEALQELSANMLIEEVAKLADEAIRMRPEDALQGCREYCTSIKQVKRRYEEEIGPLNAKLGLLVRCSDALRPFVPAETVPESQQHLICQESCSDSSSRGDDNGEGKFLQRSQRARGALGLVLDLVSDTRVLQTPLLPTRKR
ncbi:hypothetical protein C8034_v005700 [Colletotrichum sidae]|uniref:Uncharacterized protein n=1 Tax=Colletotrichum sidae TaxID=1347389 RepID=A0A4R8TSF5_9PEZI|nr:hypothetical protein C8034_v005700 [Colletotrichum sidae]